MYKRGWDNIEYQPSEFTFTIHCCRDEAGFYDAHLRLSRRVRNNGWFGVNL